MTDQTDLTVQGDTDKWILFDRQTVDGYPLVVLARTGNAVVERSIHQEIVTVVRCEADASIVNDRGMPGHTDRVYEVEDQIANQLEALDVTAFHIASVTGDGLRRLVYSHSSALDFEPIVRQFHVDGYSLSSGLADDRAAIIALVSPTNVEQQLNGDLGVISNLEKHGDDGRAVRKTDFWFYGGRGALEAAAVELQPWGYSIDHWLSDPEGVVLTTDTAVDFETFRDITPVLVEVADRHALNYDGWETFVALPKPHEAEPQKPKSLLSRLFGKKDN
jgi:hypothetical protein